MNDVHSINHTAICVHDLPQAIRFYCDVLGARPHQRTNFSTEDALAGVAVFESVIIEDYLIALGVAPARMPMPDAKTFPSTVRAWSYGVASARAPPQPP